MSVALTIFALGFYFDAFLKEAHFNEAKQKISYAKDRVRLDFQNTEKELREGIGFIKDDDSFIASMELINNYQDKLHYDSTLLDEEKKYLIEALLDKVKISFNSIIKIYDKNEELVAYLYKDEKGYRENFISYENGEKVLFSKYERERSYHKDVYTRSPMAPFEHVKYYTQPELMDHIVVTRHFFKNKIYVRAHHSIFDKTRKSETLVHVEMSKVFDEAYFETISRQLNLKASFQAPREEGANAPKMFETLALEDENILDEGNDYLVKYSIDVKEGNLSVAFALDKSHLNATLSKNRKRLLFFLAAAVIFVLAFVSFLIRFQITNPIERIMKQIAKAKQGDYSESDIVKTADELREISLSINALAASIGSREHSIKESQKESEFLSTHDELTGLLNRRSFNLDLAHALLKAKRNKTRVAVLFLDLDMFKQINDTLGHSTGDELLKSVSNRLQAILGESDVLARVGGDEFNVFVDGFKNIAEIRSLSQKILDVFEAPFADSDNEIVISTSIGVAIFHDGQDVETLIKNSDLAMYSAKEMGRNVYSFYAASFSKHLQERVDVLRALKQGIKNQNEFFLLYQPKISVKTAEIVGVEALVRWNSPELGFMGPNSFIPMAEESHMIIDLGAWILKKACQDFMELKRGGHGVGTMSVNVSGVQLRYSDMLQTLKDAIASTKISPSELELEVTESYISANEKSAIETLDHFRSLGVGLAIDDFGTGYSSMSYLHKLPITRLKIDKSFVDDLPESPESVALANVVLSLAEAFHLKVTVEGVETQKQLDFFKDKPCDDIQGYFYSKPLAFDELKEFIKKSINANATHS
jgi:diguanylate cyclase (GGDEF)-like protein